MRLTSLQLHTELFIFSFALHRLQELGMQLAKLETEFLAPSIEKKGWMAKLALFLFFIFATSPLKHEVLK